MVHFNSFTGFANTSFAIENASDSLTSKNISPVILRTFGWVLHHMCHAYIPLRCYGKGYRPFTWEMAPIIKTIWFNEGFAQYISLHLLHRFDIAKIKARVDNAPAFINNMSMRELSELASTQYSSDSRVGGQLVARGILMANDLDKYIREKTNNKKSLQDALKYIFNWSQRKKRAFTIEEMSGFFRQATGVDVNVVFEKWMEAVTE